VDTTPFECDEAARERLRNPARVELGLAADDIAVLFSGKISWRKGPDVLVEAAKLLPAPLRAKICICFLGDGQMRSEVQRLAGIAPSVRVRVLGFQNQTRLSRYYHAADLLVLPSREGETWGLVVNEALHHGLPCVVSDAVGCAPDLIELGVTGFTGEPCSAAGLSGALAQSLALMGRTETRTLSRARADQYTVSAAAHGVATAFRQVAQRPSEMRMAEPVV
jgi:glycosyltransferase involved in cell wall biosynthesis